jgi:hypothetical protein
VAKKKASVNVEVLSDAPSCAPNPAIVEPIVAGEPISTATSDAKWEPPAQIPQYVPPPGETSVPRFCEKELLAILGTAETLPAAPYDNPDFEMWAVAVCTTYPACKRVDVQFEMHGDGYWRDKNVFTRLKNARVPIYMHQHHDDLPMSIRYPIEIITEKYARYHTNSISYMLALAYHSYLTTKKPKHVAMFGIHMAAREEYTDQRPCCEYWIGVMRGAGMDVEPSPGGAIMASRGLYGYEDYLPICHEFRQRIQGLTMGFQQSQAEVIKWQAQLNKQQGAVQENEYWLRRHQTGNIPRNSK